MPANSPDPPVFALAKIQPPRLRPGLIARPRLEQALGQALRQQRLTLLQAPAGYGKTSALTRQLQQLDAGQALAWISADEDDDLQRFLACLGAALEPLDLPWRVAPEALATLVLGERGPRQAADEIANALDGAEVTHGLIVIDDLHRLADARVPALLQLLLERLPARWGLVLASRTEPDLPLARLRASEELAEFRQEDFRFDAEEVGELLAQNGGPAGGTASELLQRTEGWAAGLRLTLAARGASGAALQAQTRRHLFDYLASEVLAQMPAALQDFLLRSAVLPELSAVRCAALLELPPAQAARLLDEVERRGLFVSTLDGRELTLRLHDLFRDFLDDQLERRHGAELPGLLRRAAAAEPDLARAVAWLARAGAWDEAAARVAGQGPGLIAFGGILSLKHILGLFPPERLAASPELLWLQSMVAFMRFEFETMTDSAQHAALAFERAGRPGPALQARLMALVGMQSVGRASDSAAALDAMDLAALPPPARALAHFTRAWAGYATLRIDEVAPNFAAMLVALEQQPDVELWSQCFFHSFLHGLPGMAALLARFDTQALRLVQDQPSQLRGGVFHSRAAEALTQGRLDEAREWLARGAEELRWLGSPRSLQVENLLNRCVIEAACGRFDEAREAYERLVADTLDSPPSNRHSHGSETWFTGMRVAWLAGDAELLESQFRRLLAAEHPIEWPIAAPQRLIGRAMLALQQDRPDVALPLLEQVHHEQEITTFFLASGARWLRADALIRLGRLDEAATLLGPWLARALTEGDVGGALVAGPRVLERVAAQRWGERLPAEQLALLQRLLGRAACPAPAPGGGRSGRADELSERERAVLARIAAGDSNKLIARAFELSPFTVKRHVANILDKLGASSRGQAAAWWRERGGGAG